MKNKKSLFVVALLLSMGAMAQQKTAPCSSCGATGSGIAAFKYLLDKQVNYKVTDCVPFSDIEIYSTPQGGKVVASAVADENGEANFTLPETTPVAFALNHDRVNANGISGKGKVFELNAALLKIESPKLNLNKDKVSVNWQTNTFNNDWDLQVQRSTDGINFITVKTISAANKGFGMQSYTVEESIGTLGVKGVLYKVRAVNKTNDAVVDTEEQYIKMGDDNAMFTTAALNNQVQVSFTTKANLPATYFITDASGRKVGSGIIRNYVSLIDLGKLQSNNYVLSVMDSKHITASEQVVKK
jgi:hypothetical protein